PGQLFGFNPSKILEPLPTELRVANRVLHIPMLSERRALSRRRRRGRTDLRDAALLLEILPEAQCQRWQAPCGYLDSCSPKTTRLEGKAVKGAERPVKRHETMTPTTASACANTMATAVSAAGAIISTKNIPIPTSTKAGCSASQRHSQLHASSIDVVCAASFEEHADNDWSQTPTWIRLAYHHIQTARC